jgi:hypothetical protein
MMTSKSILSTSGHSIYIHWKVRTPGTIHVTTIIAVQVSVARGLMSFAVSKGQMLALANRLVIAKLQSVTNSAAYIQENP